MSEGGPLTSILCRNDIGLVYQQLCLGLALEMTKWYNIGLALGIDKGTLEGIGRRAGPGNDYKALLEMIQKWFFIEAEPTWKKVCASLCSLYVGRHVLAKQIEHYVLTQGMLYYR